MSRSEALEILQAPTYSNEDLAIERPYVLKKLGFDPAISTGPFVTTAIDIIGVALYFVIASTILIN